MEHFLKAKELQENNDNIKALSQIDLAISIDNLNPEFQLLKADIVSEGDNYDEAINILVKLIDKKIKLDTLNLKLSDYYYQFATYKSVNNDNKNESNSMLIESLNTVNKAINFNLHYYDAYVLKIKVLHNLGNNEEALVVLTSAIRIFPDSILLFSLRGIEKIYAGDHTGAMSDLTKAIKSNKLDSFDLADAYRFRADIYLEKSNTASAIIDLSKSISYYSKNPYTFINRAECYKAINSKEKACDDYRKAADLGYVSLYKLIKEYCSN